MVRDRGRYRGRDSQGRQTGRDRRSRQRERQKKNSVERGRDGGQLYIGRTHIL
jgi:hypothetical protein